MEENPSDSWVRSQDLELCWRPTDPVTSEQILRSKLPEARALTGRNRGFLIELLCQIARTEAAQGKVTEAETTLSEAELMLNDVDSAYPVSAKIRWLIERSRLFVTLKMPARARPLLSQAWTLAVHSAEDFFTVEITMLMATIEPPKGQEEWIRKGIQIAEDSPQDKPRRSLGRLNASLAWKLFDLRQFESALETHKKSLSNFRAHGSPREVFVAQWSVGRVLRQLGRIEEALAIQEALHAEMGIHDQPDGRLFEEIAECLHELKKTEQAQNYFELAYKELSSNAWVADNQPLKLKRLKDLGRVK